ncbi:MAG: TraR/DksA C4-type zinc finger protein [Patescibacteria group bacterium]
MLKKDLQQFKNHLEKEKKEIESELKKHKNMQRFGGTDTLDIDQETDESETYVNQLSVMQTYKNRLGEINSALKKLKNGKYGVCEKCEKEISAKVLKVNPESRLCQECKKKK